MLRRKFNAYYAEKKAIKFTNCSLPVYQIVAEN